MSLTFVERCAEAAARRVGRPYIWAGKGDYRIDQPTGQLVQLASPGFDCSGLVTDMMREAGYNDRRNDWNAQAMFDQLAAPPAAYGFSKLAFFGTEPKAIHHVCFCLDGDIFGWCIEAAGGDQTTLAPEAGKRVFLHRGAFWGPSRLQGYRALPSIP